MKKSGCLSIVLGVLLCVSLFVNLLLLVALVFSGIKAVKPVSSGRKFSETRISPGTSSEKIAVIQLAGIIEYDGGINSDGSLVDDMKDAFQQAADDPDVKAVVLSINSPGGEVTAGDTIYHALGNLRSKKPVVIFINSIGTSAAYYISCAGSWIMCSDTSFTGSIGVIISTLNYKELFGKIGLQSVVFKSGQFKDALNGDRDLTDDEKTYFQGLVMQTYDRFLNIVATSRHLDPIALRNGIADGRVLSGKDAYAAKLIDQLGYIEDAYEKARLLGNAPGAGIVRYDKKEGFGSLLKLFENSEKTDVHLDLNLSSPVGGVKLESGRIYLLPSFYAL